MARESAENRQLVGAWDRLERRARDLIELDELASNDPELQKQVDAERAEITSELRARELDLLFTDPYANNNAVLTLSVGQGGVEAQDWVEMLMVRARRAPPGADIAVRPEPPPTHVLRAGRGDA